LSDRMYRSVLAYRAHEERNRDGLLCVRHRADWSGLDELGFRSGFGGVHGNSARDEEVRDCGRLLDFIRINETYIQRSEIGRGGSPGDASMMLEVTVTGLWTLLVTRVDKVQRFIVTLIASGGTF